MDLFKLLDWLFGIMDPAAQARGGDGTGGTGGGGGSGPPPGR